MGKQIRIPKILAIDWWWLLIVGLFETYLRYLFHLPDWVPSISGFWVFLQAGWLLKAEPRSRAIYYYACSTLAEIIVSMPWVSRFLSNYLAAFLGFCIAATWIAGIFIFRAEMVRHFTQTEPRGVELGPIMTFFFNILYFQYWFHQIYVEQNEPDLRFTGTA